jgi:hypothetical protein
MAGLSITEVMVKLREDHEAQLAARDKELDAMGLERDHAVKQYEERNKLLTEVMAHMQATVGPPGG